MVFASLIFLTVFLPLHLVLYYAVDNKTYRNILLTLFSLAFYAWGEPVWIILLIISAMVDYGNGRWIEHFRGTAHAKWGLISSLLVNLGLLATFKYNVFLYENFNALFGTAFEPKKYALPIGISFYSFQTISYTVDVYRGQVKAQKSFLRFLMFVSLFHQLVAGPIVRYSDIEDDINNRKETAYDISQGILRFCIGLFKKVFIANVAGGLAVLYLGDGGNPLDLTTITVAEAWFGILMFALQIYYDFSGYSDMAIGLGRMFGFHYYENFNYPYIAKNTADFWRRWHMSLGSFSKDYIYIPLGGNRKGKLRGYLNLFIVWFLTGLWHGASWNFVFWGLYFGVLILLERLILNKIFKRLPAIFSHAYLLIAVMFSWVLFYFEDSSQLFQFFEIMVGASENALWNFKLGLVLKEHAYWLALAVLLCLPIYPPFGRWFENKLRFQSGLLYWWSLGLIQLILLLVSMALLVGDSFNPFIYYRF